MARPKSKHVEYEGSNNRDALAEKLQKALNSRRKDGVKTAFFLDEADDPSTIVDWVSTGSTMADLAISNRPNGGLPVGRIVEINGLESTGKSMLSAHIISETQKRGGMAVLIDSENSAAPEFWSSLGVDIPNLLYVQCDTIEDIFQSLESIIGEARKDSKDRLLTVIVDSIAGAPTSKELEADHGIDGYNTGKAIIVSKAMRKIVGLIGRQRILPVFTNQLRMNLNAMAFGDKYIVPGGKGLAYAASVRLRLSKIGAIKNADKVVIGNTIGLQVQKNRCGPPMRTATFDVHFDSGIQDLSSWLDFMKDNGIITGTRAGYTFKSESDGEVKFNADRFVELINTTPSFKEEVYSTICNKHIMKYRLPNSKIEEDVIKTDGDEGEKPEISE